jgi:hypothetical protein
MGEYETNAYHSVERLKADQAVELNEFREGFFARPGNRYILSKRVIDLKSMEKKAF